MSTHEGISGKIQLQGVTRLSDENFYEVEVLC